MGARTRRWRRAVEVTRVARRSGLLRVLAEIGVVGDKPATREGAVEFRGALEELGTTYIKLGQLLSSRPDLLPDVYIEELSKLVDEIEPVPYELIEPVIAEELGLEPFAEIDPDPLATASIAQIHPALLKTGRRVVVKVRRPGIVEQVELDLEVLRSTAKLLEGHSQTAQLLQLEALTEELEAHLRDELNLVEEAHNAEVIRRLVEEHEELVVPEVIHPYVTERVLVLERIDGVKVDEASRARPGTRATARACALQGLRAPRDRRGRLPRRPAPRERPADRRRTAGAARLRAARARWTTTRGVSSRSSCSRSRRTARTTWPT